MKEQGHLPSGGGKVNPAPIRRDTNVPTSADHRRRDAAQSISELWRITRFLEAVHNPILEAQATDHPKPVSYERSWEGTGIPQRLLNSRIEDESGFFGISETSGTRW